MRRARPGLIGLTKALAAEYGPQGIRVNALLPGGTDTPASITNAGATPEESAFVEGLHALKRMAQPEEIAWSALYLASDASSFTTGTALARRRRRIDQPDLKQAGGDPAASTKGRGSSADCQAGFDGALFMFGRKIVSRPNSGRNEQIQKT